MVSPTTFRSRNVVVTMLRTDGAISNFLDDDEVVCCHHSNGRLSGSGVCNGTLEFHNRINGFIILLRSGKYDFVYVSVAISSRRLRQTSGKTMHWIVCSMDSQVFDFVLGLRTGKLGSSPRCYYLCFRKYSKQEHLVKRSRHRNVSKTKTKKLPIVHTIQRVVVANSSSTHNLGIRTCLAHVYTFMHMYIVARVYSCGIKILASGIFIIIIVRLPAEFTRNVGFFF